MQRQLKFEDNAYGLTYCKTGYVKPDLFATGISYDD